jgi:hypothetical protein
MSGMTRLALNMYVILRMKLGVSDIRLPDRQAFA